MMYQKINQLINCLYAAVNEIVAKFEASNSFNKMSNNELGLLCFFAASEYRQTELLLTAENGKNKKIISQRLDDIQLIINYLQNQRPMNISAQQMVQSASLASELLEKHIADKEFSVDDLRKKIALFIEIDAEAIEVNQNFAKNGVCSLANVLEWHILVLNGYTPTIVKPTSLLKKVDYGNTEARTHKINASLFYVQQLMNESVTFAEIAQFHKYREEILKN